MDNEKRTHLWDPNGELTNEELHWAHYAGCMPFNLCRIKPKLVVREHCRTMILGEMGDKKHLVYVRVTHDEDEEDGTGKMTHALLDTALELHAKPHIVRINIKDDGENLWFKYWGMDEATAALKANVSEYQAILLKGKTAADFLRIKGKLDTISLENETTSRSDNSQMQIVHTVIKINGQPIKWNIDYSELLHSVCGLDEFWIFTCSCGVPECAGIERGVTVVSQDGLTVWMVYYPKPCRVFVFDEMIYRDEVLERIGELANLLKLGHIPADEVYGYERDIVGKGNTYLENSLAKAKERMTNNGIFNHVSGPISIAHRKGSLW